MCVPTSLRRWLTSLGVGVASVAGLLAVSTEASAQLHFDVLHTFAAPVAVHPFAPLVQATDGNFYGTTNSGGASRVGTVFQITPSGALTVLHAFSPSSEGAYPMAGLIQATDGNLYGTTTRGGASGSGTVFQITPAGTLTVLHAFSFSGEGGNPRAGLVQAADGNFYGTTASGGASGVGTVFQITPSGTLTVLHTFSGGPDGATPHAGVIQGTDGNLYGTTSNGGASGAGTVFKLTLGGTYTLLHEFSNDGDGAYPEAGLVQATDGNLYGTTPNGGFYGAGTVFQITTTGRLTVLYHFSSLFDIDSPASSLVQATDGTLYGTAHSGLPGGRGTVFKITPSGTLTVLHVFSGGADGDTPVAGVIQGSDGNFYGTTSSGGPSGGGTVFKITTTGTLTVLYGFGYSNDGGLPAGLVQATDGNLYGTTAVGGVSGWGTVFKITPAGILTTLHAFDGVGDGTGPYSSLVQATDGNLYGTSSRGGVVAYPPHVQYSGSGTVFKITTTGTLSVLKTFGYPSDFGTAPTTGVVQATDGNFYGETLATVFQMTPSGRLAYFPLDVFGSTGEYPAGGLIQATDGNFYGTTELGGASNAGTVFKITTTGTYTLLHEFSNDVADGAYPAAGLVQATDGNLYGTTRGGGAANAGTVFKMTLGGTLTVLHMFNFTDGSGPVASLVQAADGNLCGTAQFGGAKGRGTVFTITPSGTLTVLYVFSGGTDGANPVAGVIQGTDGNFYGTTPYGGATGGGVVFRLGSGVTVRGDSDGDGKADLVVFRPSTGQWFVGQSTTNYSTVGSYAPGGSSADTPVPGDYDGDGRMDLAVYRRSTGQWFVSLSSTNFSGYSSYTWGRGSDVPVPGDYDGDGKTDLAVYRPSTGQWFMLLSSTNNTMFTASTWGMRGDLPVPGDYDGDGKTDLAVYRRSAGQWWIGKSSTHTTVMYQWGTSTDLPVPGDYDGDGKADLAVFSPSAGLWSILSSSSGFTVPSFYTWGASTDIPVPADYDGDGKIDLAIFRPSTGQWFIAFSRAGYSTSAVYDLGVSTDLPAIGVAVSVLGITDTTRASDFDRDQKADLAIFRPSTGQWLIEFSGANYSTAAGYTWGVSTDTPAPGDYDGDGKADLAVFRPSTGQWFVAFSSTNYSAYSVYYWGASTDTPVPGDYDGDGKTDLAIFRPSTGQWFISLSSSNYTASVVYTLGISTDTLVPGDYDGDGKTDLAVYRNGQWLMLLSSANYASVVTRLWGTGTDVAVPGDYDGDGLTDLAFYSASTGLWRVLQSSTGNPTYHGWFAGSGYVAVPADYDGDGKTDIAVFQLSTGHWWVLQSSTGYTTYAAYSWGTSTDIPLVRRQ